ncbi:hypothetical protein Riv7116_0176 [Rivularia sp. PCC 7116]|uniref:hypothetical protein n=1 Tax=Rivularia sp. PCC 7116 TaxID=373994 RepID=UPI00029ED4CB|nr:hypothetical protein [Rivularia sp. PCC 7116]AFY52784.1 hypothetical protein Riv7116_0176 [Rivularia sp. PCC 7116]
MKNKLLFSGAIIIALFNLTGCGQDNANTETLAPVETTSQNNQETQISQPLSTTAETPEVPVSTSKPAKTASNQTNNSATYDDNRGNRTIRIKFDIGTSSKTVKDSVVRGTRDIYLLGANTGQQMNLNIASLEDNAVFDVISPNGQILQQETKNWSGKLPQNGDYQIVVGGTRGNATYELATEIK